MRPNLSLGLTFDVGWGTILTLPATDFAARATVKWRFAKLGPFDAGLKFGVGYYGGPTVETNNTSRILGHGVAIDASFLLSYPVNKRLTVVPFFTMPIRVAISTNNTRALIPLYVGTAVEYLIIPKLTIFGRLGIGGFVQIDLENVGNQIPPPSYPPINGHVWAEGTVGLGYAF